MDIPYPIQLVASVAAIAGMGWLLAWNHNQVCRQGKQPESAVSETSQDNSQHPIRHALGCLAQILLVPLIGACVYAVAFPEDLVFYGAAQGIQFRSALILVDAIPLLAFSSKWRPIPR